MVVTGSLPYMGSLGLLPRTIIIIPFSPTLPEVTTGSLRRAHFSHHPHANVCAQAGYDTKTSVVPRFYTFAPETLAELVGQRRRWQVRQEELHGFRTPTARQARGSRRTDTLQQWNEEFMLDSASFWGKGHDATVGGGTFGLRCL